MAEGWGKSLRPDLNFYSAGTKKHGLNPFAVEVMKEAGVDISGQSSNTTDELFVKNMDFVFTVCSDAHENCPYYPGGKIIHQGFDDPPRLTKNMKDKEDVFKVYRRVRDEIKEMIENIDQYLER